MIVVRADFLARVRRTAIVVGLLLFPFIAAYAGWREGAAWVLGGGWSLVNLYVIGLLVEVVLRGAGTKPGRFVLVAFVKVPVLYTIGFVLMKIQLPLTWLLAGFLWPLAVIVLKTAGRLVLRLDSRGAGLADSARDS